MTLSASTFFIICPLVFLAGFVDSIAGGGGLISLPAYLVAGLPIHMAYGTNKFAMSLGTLMSTTKYLRSGHVRLRPALTAAAGALVGSWAGARLALLLDERYLHYCLMVILPLAAGFLLFNRGFGATQRQQLAPTKLYPLCLVCGLVIGCYDGFFGPGTGTFLILAFTLLGFDLVTASGNAKMVNLASNIAAVAAFGLGGSVLLPVGLPAALCAILGNYLGARLAIKRGAAFIGPVAVAAVALLFTRILWDIFA